MRRGYCPRFVSTRRNRQIVLARRPVGVVSEACFDVAESDVPALGDGEALLEVRYLGIDPTIRGWLDERGNYMPGVAIGEPVRSNGVGVIVETNNPDEYPLGRAFMHLTGWQQYCVVQSNPFPPITMVPEDVQLTDVLGVLGHIGITAYVGVLRVARPQPGEMFLVSAAASGVGSIAGQIAKMQGARVIGIAGSAAKCAWVVDDLGFDACIDYKTEDVAARLKELAPQGCRRVLRQRGRRAARHGVAPARAACPGRAVRRHLHLRRRRAAPPLHNLRYLMGKRARMEGFNTLDHWDHYGEAAAAARRVARGREVQAREHVLEGLDRAPEALVRLFKGDHLGKLVVRLCNRAPTASGLRRSGRGPRPRAVGSARSALVVGRRAGGSGASVPGDPDRGTSHRAPGAVCTSAWPPCACGDRGDDREAEAGAAALACARWIGAVEALERAVPRRRPTCPALGRSTSITASSPDSPTRTWIGRRRRRVRARVLEQVREHLAQAVLVASHDDRPLAS